MKFNITNFSTLSRFNSFANDAQWQDSRQTLAFFIEFMSNIFIANKSLFREKSLSSITLSKSGLSDGQILSTLNLASNVSSRKLKLTSNFCLRKKWFFFFCKAKKIDCRSVSTRLSTLGDLKDVHGSAQTSLRFIWSCKVLIYPAELSQMDPNVRTEHIHILRYCRNAAPQYGRLLPLYANMNASY